MAYVFDFPNSVINITSPQTEVGIQELYEAIRDAETSVEGMVYGKIADGSGKQDLGGGAAIGLTVKLLGAWQLKFWSGSYQASISGGNLLGDASGGNAGNPIAYSAGVQVVKNQSAAATVVASGGGGTGLTPTQIAQLAQAALEAKLARQLVGNKATSVPDGEYTVITIYADDGVTPVTTLRLNGSGSVREVV